jgi:hypothetical protein
MSNVVSPAMLRLERGRKMFRDGGPMPARPSDDAAYSPEEDLWLGWMLERATQMSERWRAMEILGVRE